MRGHKSKFDNVTTCFLGVAVDPRQTVESQPLTGIHYFLDKDGVMSCQCGAAPREDVPLGTQYRVTWTIVDPSLHVLAHFHTGADGVDCEAVFTFLNGLPDPDTFRSCEIPAPILVLPGLFEPADRTL
jgi:hypothetical protein